MTDTITIAQAIEEFDTLTPNQIPLPQKVRWLSRLDGTLWQECHLPGSIPLYDPDTDISRPLLVTHPHTELYRWYLEMQVWDTLGEITRYNNAAQKYNTTLLSWLDHNARNTLPQNIPLKLV